MPDRHVLDPASDRAPSTPEPPRNVPLPAPKAEAEPSPEQLPLPLTSSPPPKLS